jgi:diphthine synthase
VLVHLQKCDGEIFFVGLGLMEKHITAEAAEALRAADEIYVEGYTSFYYPDVYTSLKNLGIPEEKIKNVSRRDLEDNSGEELLRHASMGNKVALATVGDPFIATTHLALRLRFERYGCRVRYMPSVNIFSYSISKTGLFSYKFGESATVVYPRDGILSTYPYLVLEENLKRGLHTFFFLDIDEKFGPLNAAEAVKLLLRIESEERRGAFTEGTDVIIVERASWPDERIILTSAGKAKEKRLNPPHSLIVPGKLHFMEKESIEVFRT